tara:strand:+ start:119 stop:271 length:153 start_codon:yes stop_codon:yes gene_type:complete
MLKEKRCLISLDAHVSMKKMSILGENVKLKDVNVREAGNYERLLVRREDA